MPQAKIKIDGQEPIAIVGMSCLFPMAPGLAPFFGNILAGRDCLREPNENEWAIINYQNPSGSDFKKIYCVKGGFVTELADFDPLKYGVMPRAVHGSDPDQFLALRVAIEAMADAGYNNLPTAIDKGEVILGRTSAPGQGAMTMIQQGQTVDQMLALVQKLHPEISHDDIRHLAELLHGSLAPTNSDTVPGVMPNLLAGRIAQRLGFKGRNLLLDAACASSLIAVETAVRDLRTGSCDVALAGGIHINSFACFYQMFCALTALSPNQEIRPFDQAADGTILGEGIGAVVLKRYSEALENNDRIYAIIRGVGSSSDGHGTSLLAPSHEGESLAIQRAFEDAGVSAKSVGLIEAHGTGTPAGDAAELQAVKETYGADTSNSGWIALGSVKSMIGHTQAASGMAGLIKAALSLYHRVLPPTLNVVNESKSADWARHPCRISTQTRPWIHPKVHPSVEQTDAAGLKTTVEPRRAAVSAFGFGGVNAHVILEEHEDRDESKRPALIKEWETELVVFSGDSNQELLEKVECTIRLIDSKLGLYSNQFDKSQATPALCLRDLAYTLSKKALMKSCRLAIVAKSTQHLRDELLTSAEYLRRNSTGQVTDNIFLTGKESISQGRLSYVLPGLGAAYPNMLKDLCMHFPDVRMAFDYIDQMSLTYSHEDKQTKPFSELFPILPSTKLFGTPKPGRPGPQVTAALLASMDSAVVTVLLAEWSLYQLLKNLGVEPSSIVGVSTGEFAALLINGAADVLETAPVFYRLSTGVASAVSIAELAKLRSIKVTGDWEVIEPILKKLPHTVYLGADLSPKQMLLSGAVDAIAAAKKAIEAAGFEVLPLPIAIPYHTPLVEGKVHAGDEAVKAVTVSKPKITTWACSLIDKYPDDTEAIRKITTELFTRPIHFKKTIEAMYAEGTRIFVEVGPRGGMTPVIDEVLFGKEYLAIASNLQSESGITQLNRTLASLFCLAVPLKLDYLFERRANIIDLDPDAKPARSTSMRLSLKYPEISLAERPNLPSIQQDSVRAPDYFTDERSESRPFSDANAADLPFPHADETQQYDQAENLYVQPQDEEDPFRVIDAVMDNYIKTLESFHTNIMAVQAQIFSQFFTAKEQHDPNLIEYDVHDVTQGTTAPAGFESTPPLMPGSYQLTSNMFSRLPAFMESSYIINCTPEEIEILLPLTLDSHRYLKDHAIGGAVRFSAGPSLNAAQGEDERVHLLPLTVAIEMMCEAASLVGAGQIVTAVENIRAMRRIRVGQEGVWLLVFAKREAKGATAGLKVVRQDEWLSLAGGGEHYSGQHRLDTADMTAQILLGKERPAKPSKNASPPDGRPPNLAENQLYADGNMFHGPRMQSVRRIESVGKREITGIVSARTAADWFGQTLPYATRTTPTFIADPLLLDNSTQLVLFHLYEHQENCTALLPFHVQSLTLYKPLGVIQGEVRVFARLRSISDRGTEADVEISTLDGQLIAEFESISSRRIALSDTLKQFVKTPAESLVAEPIEDLSLPLQLSSEIAVAFIKSSDIPDDETVATWLSDYFLTGVEQQYLSDSITRRERKREWLLGRIAAKDAMRRLYQKTLNNPLPPLELSILPSQNGAPFVQSHLLQSQGITTQISITHKDGYAVALARFAQGNASTLGYGIDYEPYSVREDGIERLMLNEEETHFISGASPEERNQILTRIWAAKESSAKALGTGIGGNPRKWTVQSLVKEQDHYIATVLSPNHLTGNEHLLTVSIKDQFDGILAVASIGT
ncbi:MAG: polyketide synthase dehydratase domain-containing protein [Candidatus Melainabacteria bacterium]|nr:polyketide synthase dehydratase domain-containing protein [Candidatus Melainabacteria bacterium]